MFKASSKAKQALATLDWTSVLAEEGIVSASVFASLGIVGDVQCLSWDAVQHLLAVGTKLGYLYIVGKPGVYTTWQLHGSTNVKHMAFKAGSSLLCVIDGRDTLHVFNFADLDNERRPRRLFAWSARSAVTCIETSPAHSHLILGLRDGTVDFYDLDRGHASPYRIANLWLPQEELLRRSGVINAPSRRHIPMCIDVRQHPLDLNRLFVAYEGGIVLFNLRERKAEQTYELVIPPGALGGGNDPEEALLTERRPALTCITVRPDGLVLAAGTEDGCLCFWSIENGDIPLSVRTIDREQVNRIDADSMFGMGSEQDSQGRPLQGFREPIFRLAWAGLQGESLYEKVTAYAQSSSNELPAPEKAKGSMLAVLGGLLPTDIKGVHVLHFPPPITSEAGEAAEVILEKSLHHIGHSVYDTPLPPEDFTLLSRSPHYGNAWDAFAIVTIQSPFSVDGSTSNRRSMQAWSFPPSLTAVPTPSILPSSLHSNVLPLQIELFCTSSLSLQRLMHASSNHLAPRASIEGGFASALCPTASRPDVGRKTEVRLLVALLPGLKIQISDISTPLLAGLPDGSLIDDFPLPLFDIDLVNALMDPRCDRLLAHRLLKETPDLLSIWRIAFATETSELVIALSTGEVVIGRVESSRALPMPHDGNHPATLDSSESSALPIGASTADLSPHTSPPTSPPLPGGEKTHRNSISKRLFRANAKGRKRSDSSNSHASLPATVLHLLDLDGAAGNGLNLVCGISGMQGPPTCLESCDVGFVALAWPGRLIILDLRGPDIAIDETFDRGLGDIRAMSWAVSPFDLELEMAPRLLVSHDSGVTRVYTLRHTLETWMSAGPSLTFEHDSLAGPILSRIMSSRGEVLSANADALQDALRGYQPHPAQGNLPPAFMLLVSSKAAALAGQLSEGRLAKTEFEEPVIAAEVVRRHEASLLAVMTDSGALQLYSLPSLDMIHQFRSVMHFEPGASLYARIAVDGDFTLLDRSGSGEVHLGSIFGRARAISPPDLVLYDQSLHAPSRPTISVLTSLQGGMAGFASWMRSPATLTGDALDDLLAGPNRPAKKEAIVRAPPIGRLGGGRGVSAPSSTGSNTYESWSTWASNLGQAKEQSGSAHRAAAETNEMLEEREDHLARLNQGLQNLGKGAGDLFKETKKFAANEALKTKFTSMFS